MQEQEAAKVSAAEPLPRQEEGNPLAEGVKEEAASPAAASEAAPTQETVSSVSLLSPSLSLSLVDCISRRWILFDWIAFGSFRVPKALVSTWECDEGSDVPPLPDSPLGTVMISFAETSRG